MAMSRKRRVLALASARGIIEHTLMQMNMVLHEIMMHEHIYEQMHGAMPEVNLSRSRSDHKDTSFNRTLFMPLFLWN